MGSKPTATKARLRKLVREVLAMAPGYGFSDAMLTSGVRELLPVNAASDVAILTEAEWNLGKEYVSTSENEDTDEREWKITQHGLAKENLK